VLAQIGLSFFDLAMGFKDGRGSLWRKRIPKMIKK